MFLTHITALTLKKVTSSTLWRTNFKVELEVRWLLGHQQALTHQALPLSAACVRLPQRHRCEGLLQAVALQQVSARVGVGCRHGLTLCLSSVTLHFNCYLYFWNIRILTLSELETYPALSPTAYVLFCPRALLFSLGPSGTDPLQSEAWRGSSVVLRSHQPCFMVPPWSRVLGTCVSSDAWRFAIIFWETKRHIAELQI